MKLKTMAVFILALLLVACNDEVLYSELSEQEANEMVALMYAADMPAEKMLVKGGSYTVTTSKSAFPDATVLLRSQGLPREKFDTIGNVFKKEGFVSSPLEESARLNYALSQEISKTISSIDGVVMVRVNLAVPEKRSLGGERDAARAAVVIKHRPDVDLSSSVGKIKSIVINSVEGLTYEKVSIELFPQEAFTLPPRAKLQPPPAMSGRLAMMQIASPVSLVIAGLLLIGGVLWRMFVLQRKEQSDGNSN